MRPVAIVTDSTHYTTRELVAAAGVHEVSLYVRDGEKAPTLYPVATTHARWARQGLSGPELDHLVEQIRAASERAHGKFVLKHEPEAIATQLRRARECAPRRCEHQRRLRDLRGATTDRLRRSTPIDTLRCRR